MPTKTESLDQQLRRLAARVEDAETQRNLSYVCDPRDIDAELDALMRDAEGLIEAAVLLKERLAEAAATPA